MKGAGRERLETVAFGIRQRRDPCVESLSLWLMEQRDAKQEACELYARFLIKSYLKWECETDLCNTSCIVKVLQPTIARGQSFYPSAFIDSLGDAVVAELEAGFGCTATGWRPHVECTSQSPDAAQAAAFRLSIRFSRLPSLLKDFF
jgi:hypothetical protein